MSKRKKDLEVTPKNIFKQMYSFMRLAKRIERTEAGRLYLENQTGIMKYKTLKN